MSPEESESLRKALPREVVVLGLDPVVALLVTTYVLYIGKTIGEEMAATTGFPVLPPNHTDRLDLMRVLEIHLDTQWAVGLIEALEQSLRVPPRVEISEEPEAAEALLIAAAILNQGERTEPQSEKLTKTLSEISASSAYDRDDIEHWNRGLKAISRITRLMIEAVTPTRIGTMDNLSKPDSGLRLISTLGGALFLGHSIGVLTGESSVSPPSPYAALGGRIALLTNEMGGQLVKVPSVQAAEQYGKDLARFARSGDSVFAIEHPFHFRVLLEVMSDENRRYPAEPVLNVAALRHMLPGDSFWSHVVWSRDQLPVVVNLLRLPERQRADAFIQHYAAFGRTPHTSSFTHLDYEVSSLVGDESAAASWPDAFQRYRGRALRNMPNSVSQVIHAVNRQRSLGRLWRGTPDESDLRWLCGQVVAWDGHREADGALADRVWRSDLRLRLATAVSPATRDDAESPAGQERLDQELRANEELRVVLEIMALFSADYISGEEDGIPGLQKTLRQLRGSHWAAELGPKIGEKLDYVEACLNALGAQLSAEIREAREALARPA
jgi:hypothetical protein